MKSVLTNGKVFLNFATASVFESLRRNPELCNFVLSDISNNDTSNPSNYHSLILSGEQQQSFGYISDDDICTAVILEEAEKLYNKLTTELTNRVMASKAVAIKESSLPSTVANNGQKFTNEYDNTYDKMEEFIYNNNLEIYNNQQKYSNERLQKISLAMTRNIFE